MKFLVKEQGKFKEFLSLHFYQIYPKSEEKGEQIFPKKNLHILETQFLTPHLIFIAFLCMNIFQIANFGIFSTPKAQF